MESLVKSLTQLLPLIIAIGSLITFAAWVKLTILGLQNQVNKLQADTDKRFEVLESLIRTISEKMSNIEMQIASDISEIKTLLRTRPCMEHDRECGKR